MRLTRDAKRILYNGINSVATAIHKRYCSLSACIACIANSNEYKRA